MRGKPFLFFLAATLSIVAIFVFAAPRARAYAVAPNGQPSGSSAAPSNGFGANYSFSGSFQNLTLPFRSFFNSMQWNTNTGIQIHPTSTMMPVINITPGMKNIFVSIDDWFYGLTNFRLSGLVYVILNGLSWTLGLAKGIADWLLGLFHA